MKLWEVMKALDVNPAKVFEATLDFSSNTVRMSVVRGVSRYFRFEIFNGSELIDESLGGGAFNGNVNIDLNWQEVKYPVTDECNVINWNGHIEEYIAQLDKLADANKDAADWWNLSEVRE